MNQCLRNRGKPEFRKHAEGRALLRGSGERALFLEKSHQSVATHNRCKPLKTLFIIFPAQCVNLAIAKAVVDYFGALSPARQRIEVRLLNDQRL